MRKGVFVVALLSVLLLMPTCKSNESSSKPAPTPTTQSIIVTSSSDMFYIGVSETFTATATMSDGTTKAVIGGSWGGDNPNVATVEASTGKVTIVGSGNVNIFVDFGGQRGSKAIRGLPNYQGTWSGSYYVVACYSSGDFSTNNWCNDFPANKAFPAKFYLTQNRDEVSGLCVLSLFAVDTRGRVGGDGSLTLTGIQNSWPNIIEVTLNLQSTAPGKVTGSLNWLWRSVSLSGDSRLSANFRDMNTTGFAPPP